MPMSKILIAYMYLIFHERSGLHSSALLSGQPEGVKILHVNSVHVHVCNTTDSRNIQQGVLRLDVTCMYTVQYMQIILLSGILFQCRTNKLESSTLSLLLSGRAHCTGGYPTHRVISRTGCWFKEMLPLYVHTYTSNHMLTQ